MQRVADRLDLAQIGGQRWNTISVGRRRRVGRFAADQRNDSNPGEALKLQARHGVLADRGILVDPDFGDDLARVVELERQDFADLHAIEGDKAAAPQAARRATLEHDAHPALLRDLVELAETQQAEEPDRQDHERDGSDLEIAGTHLGQSARDKRLAWRYPCRRLYGQSE